MEQEHQFLDLLNRVERWDVSNIDQLRLWPRRCRAAPLAGTRISRAKCAQTKASAHRFQAPKPLRDAKRRRFSPLNPGNSLPYDRRLASEASSARWRLRSAKLAQPMQLPRYPVSGTLVQAGRESLFMPARPLERAASCFAQAAHERGAVQNRRSCSKPPRRSINRTPTPIRRTGRARREGGRQQVGIVVQLQAGASLFQGGLGEVMKLEFDEWLAGR